MMSALYWIAGLWMFIEVGGAIIRSEQVGKPRAPLTRTDIGVAVFVFASVGVLLLRAAIGS